MHLEHELIRTAVKLLEDCNGSSPSEADRRRAVSTAYYALFHFTARSCVDVFMPSGKRPLARAKQQAYRSIDHRDVKNACTCTKNPKFGAPIQIRRFADTFLTLNKYRERADYDPSVDGEFKLNHVIELIGECIDAMTEFRSADIDDRRAFAVQVCLKSKVRA